MTSHTFAKAVLLLSLAAPATVFAQGATSSPPSPNASNSEPTSPNSVPPGARTLRPGTTGTGRIGTVSSTPVGPDRAMAPGSAAR